MLIDIELKKDYVSETLKERKNLIKLPAIKGKQREYIEKSIESIKNIKNISDLFCRHATGIYKGQVYEDYLVKLTGKNFKLVDQGTADNIEQICNYYKNTIHLNDCVIIYNNINNVISDKNNISNLGKYIGIGNTDFKNNHDLKKILFYNVFKLEDRDI